MTAYLHPADVGGRAFLAPADVEAEEVPEVMGVTVSPATATGSTTFTATVNGNSPSQSVLWSRSPAIGTISALGVFSAPEQTNDVQVTTITATSVADSNYFGTATVTIPALPPREPAPEFVASRKGRGRSRSRR